MNMGNLNSSKGLLSQHHFTILCANNSLYFSKQLDARLLTKTLVTQKLLDQRETNNSITTIIMQKWGRTCWLTERQANLPGSW